MQKNDKYLKKLGEKIQKLSKNKYPTNVAFANACDMDPRSIGRITRGTQNPTVTALRKISKALDTELHELVNVGG